MKIMILSDSHRSKRSMEKIIPIIEEKIDLIIHAGDNFEDSRYLNEKTGVDCIAVTGNCDYERGVEDELEFELEGIKFFLTHGHKYGVKYGPQTLAKEAANLGVDVVIYGHSHEKYDDFIFGVRVINPGSLSQPRDDVYGSYVIMDVHDKSFSYEFFRL